MDASPFSTKPYYPMLLANGNDAVLLDYSGSMFTGLTGHAHFEKHQYTPSGWYKTAHTSRTTAQTMPPIVQCGYQVIGDGEVLDPSDYRQKFDPRAGVLTSTLAFRGAVVIVESFLTRDGIFREHYRLTTKGAYTAIDVAFLLMPPHPQNDLMTFRDLVSVRIDQGTDARELVVQYVVSSTTRGRGLMVMDAAGDAPVAYHRGARGILFRNVAPGWSMGRCLTFTDDSESPDQTAILTARKQRIRAEGSAELRHAHKRNLRECFSRSDITVPDADMQYLFDLGRYIMLASFHQTTGGLANGLLPHLWGGGTHCISDALYMHRALLLTGASSMADRHLGYYRRQYADARNQAKAAGVDGAMFMGWTDWEGGPRSRDVDIQAHIMHAKPWFSALVPIMIYWQWKYTADDGIIVRYLDIVESIVAALRTFVVDDGEAVRIKPCQASNESEIEVQNDTMSLLCLARAFQAYGEMADAIGRKVEDAIGAMPAKLRGAMAQNLADGILMPYRKAAYSATLQFMYFLFNLPDGIDSSSIYEAERRAGTLWGLDNEQPSERYRDWPWLASRASICYSHLGDSDRAFRWLRHPLDDASSLGALPEKIRLDGYPINYWYATPYALLVWALCAALVHIDRDGNLKLLFGLDGSWKDVEVRDLPVPGGIVVSLSVRDGRIARIFMTNRSRKEFSARLLVNGRYAAASVPLTATMAAGTEWRWGEA